MDPQTTALPPELSDRSLPWWISVQAFMYGWPAIVLQLLCLIHVIRTGRPYWWFWVIMCFPFIGAIAYLFVEVRPSLGAIDWQAILWRFKSPRARIQIREEAFEESPSANRCTALAAELRSQGMHERACEVLASGLVGPFQNDTTLLLLLANSHLEVGEPDEAQKCLDRCTDDLRSDEKAAFGLCRARILSMKGRLDEAEPIFRDLTKGRRSEAARYHFGKALVQAGRSDEALAIVDDILKRYRRGTPVYRNLEREWFLAARRLRKEACGRR